MGGNLGLAGAVRCPSKAADGPNRLMGHFCHFVLKALPLHTTLVSKANRHLPFGVFIHVRIRLYRVFLDEKLDPLIEGRGD